MFRDLIIKRVVGVLGVAGALAATQLVGPAVATAAPAVAPTAYPPSVVTNTDESLSKSRINPGDSDAATARVSSGAGTPSGTVTFQVAGHAPVVKQLQGGTASYSLPTDLAAGKTYKVTAHYNGSGIYRPSSGTAYVTVNGQGHVQNGNGNGGSSGGAGGNGQNGGGKGRTSPTINGTVLDTQTINGASGLPRTGADESTMLYGAGGLVLVLAGGLTLAMRRRRTHA